MNSGFWWNKQCMKADDSFWPHLSKDSRKQMLGTYDEFLRMQKKMKGKAKFVEEEEGGEE
jgi:hypothetical protein